MDEKKFTSLTRDEILDRAYHSEHETQMFVKKQMLLFRKYPKLLASWA